MRFAPGLDQRFSIESESYMNWYDAAESHDDKPLYCFKIEDDGRIVKYTILYYNEVRRSQYVNRVSYCFKYQFASKHPSKYEVRSENIDKVVNKKYYTFNPDEKTALLAIYKQMLSKKFELLEKADNISRLIDNIEDMNRGRF